MRGRVIILVVLVIIIAIVVVGALLLATGGGDDETAEAPAATVDTSDPVAVAGATATAVAQAAAQADIGEDGNNNNNNNEEDADITGGIDVVPVVIAQQDLPRGFEITEEFISGASPAVGIAFWPVGSAPQNGFESVEELEGTIVRSDIPRESPVLSTQLVGSVTDLADVGSDAALLLDPGLVAVSIPLDPSGIGQVAYALQHGDFVDVILSFLFIEVDETFQSRQPNTISVISRGENGDLQFGGQLEGRPEPSTLSSLGVLVSPSEQQRPRLVTQRTIQRAFVVHVGYFPEDGQIVGVMTPTPFNTATPDPNNQQAAASDQQAQTQAQSATAFAQLVATQYQPVIVTLGVEPQDALVLTWALDANIPITLALRSATDAGTTPTTAVTLQYLIENYNIPQPPILPFALEPAIRRLRDSQSFLLNEFRLIDVSTE
ncbi:MAG: hypothetical protein ACLFTK_01940 [Anaerolineales bacterium]